METVKLKAIRETLKTIRGVVVTELVTMVPGEPERLIVELLDQLGAAMRQTILIELAEKDWVKFKSKRN